MGADHRIAGQERTPAKGPTPFGQRDKGRRSRRGLAADRETRQPAGRRGRGREEFITAGKRLGQVVVPVIGR